MCQDFLSNLIKDYKIFNQFHTFKHFYKRMIFQKNKNVMQPCIKHIELYEISWVEH